MFPDEIHSLECEKEQCYKTLLTDVLMEFNTTIINDMAFKSVKLNFTQENIPKNFLNELMDKFNDSKQLLENHNKHMSNLMNEHKTI